MFIGHYAPALALRALRGSPGLAGGFVAVQLVDIGFFALAALDIEKWRPDPAITGIMPVDLYYMPYTHSLLAAGLWALAAGAVAWALAGGRRRALLAASVAALVLSHWLLDFLVHRADLGLLDDEPDKLGLGLWDHPALEMPLELGLVLVACWAYLRATRARDAWGRRLAWLLPLYLLLLQAINWWTPVPPGRLAFSALGLIAYASCAALAGWLDRSREPAAAPQARP